MKGSDRITFIRRAFCLAVVSLWLGLLTSPLCLAEVRSVNPSGSNFGKIQVKIQRPDLYIRNNFQWEITGKEAVITG